MFVDYQLSPLIWQVFRQYKIKNPNDESHNFFAILFLSTISGRMVYN